MVPGGARGSQVEVPSSARSDLSGARQPAELWGLAATENSSQRHRGAGSGMPALPRGPLASPSWAERHPGFLRAGARGRARQSGKGARQEDSAGQVAVLRWRAGRTDRSHLGHEAVSTRVLFVLEDDIGVVVGGELLEALRAARDLAFVAPAGAQSLLRHVRAELLVGKRHEFARRPPATAHYPARPATPRRRHQQQQQEQTEP